MVGRYQPYLGYKDSGVEWLGELPEHWEVKRLGHFFEERREKVSDKDYPALSVTMQGVVPQLEHAAKTDTGDNRKLVLKNDFVINSRSDRKGSSGVSPLDGSVSLISIVMTPRKINPKFAHHLLRSYPFQEEFYRYGKGIVADLWSTNSSEMKSILMPDIPEGEQEKIANFLDYETAKIDTLIEKQQQLIKLLKEKRQAVISHAVTKGLNPNAPMRDSGVEWLGEVPEHWKITRLKYQVDMLPGYAFKSAGFVDSAEEINLLRGINIAPGKIRWDETVFWPSQNNDDLEEYILEEKDLVLGMDRPWVGGGLRLAMLSSADLPAYVVQRVARIRGKNGISQEYVFNILSDSSFLSYFEPITTGVSVPHISTDQIGEYYFALPAESERREIAEYIRSTTSKYKTLVKSADEAIKFMQERRTALISAAVTGKIDVRNWQAPKTQNINNKEVTV